MTFTPFWCGGNGGKKAKQSLFCICQTTPKYKACPRVLDMPSDMPLQKKWLFPSWVISISNNFLVRSGVCCCCCTLFYFVQLRSCLIWTCASPTHTIIISEFGCVTILLYLEKAIILNLSTWLFTVFLPTFGCIVFSIRHCNKKKQILWNCHPRKLLHI